MNAASLQNTDLVMEITAALIATLVIGGAVVIAVINTYEHNNGVSTPDWLQVAVGTVIGFYFARRSNAQNRLAYLAAMETAGNGGGNGHA